MARLVARNVSLIVEDNSKALRYLTGLTNSAMLVTSAVAPNITCFGAKTRERATGGIQDWELRFEGYFSNNSASDVDAALAGIVSGDTFVWYAPNGSNGFGLIYAGSAILKDYRVEAVLGETVRIKGTVLPRAGSLSRYQASGSFGYYDTIVIADGLYAWW